MRPIPSTIHRRHLCKRQFFHCLSPNDLLSSGIYLSPLYTCLFILIYLCFFFYLVSPISINSIYVIGKVMNWIKRNGGVDAMYANSLKKSQLIYDLIESSDGFFTCPIEKRYRSRMNVVFRVGGGDGDEQLEKDFLKGAEQLKMLQLKGHRSVGGIRASLYNAVTLEDTETLYNYMKSFHSQYKK